MSRARPDVVNAKVMADPRINGTMPEAPFDRERMIYGGFQNGSGGVAGNECGARAGRTHPAGSSRPAAAEQADPEQSGAEQGNGYGFRNGCHQALEPERHIARIDETDLWRIAI